MTSRVLKLACQLYYRWLANPVTIADVTEACRATALFNAHCDDPEFGFRFLTDQARDVGEVMTERTAWWICSANGWCPPFCKKPRWGRGIRVGPPFHDDFVERNFTAEAPNELELGDITELRTLKGKLYIWAIKDVVFHRILSYLIDTRMESSIAVNAVDDAVARCADVSTCALHSDRGSRFRRSKHVRALARHCIVGSKGRVGSAEDNAAIENFSLP